MLFECAQLPRRYLADATGNRVLIGLSTEETAEFEALEHLPAANDRQGEARWQELYAKHDADWKRWWHSGREAAET